MDGGEIVLFFHPFQEGSGDSRTLLAEAASRYSGRTAEELGPLTVGPWGKPAFSAVPHLHFSVSHSGDWWLCAFSRWPVGLDLQVHQSYTEPAKLSRRFFHPEEDRFLAQNGYHDFYDLWSAKESWVKYTGRGFFDDPGTFSVVAANGAFPALAGMELRLLPFRPGYSLCLCARRLGTVTFRPFGSPFPR